MSRRPVYAVSGSSNDHRAYVLADEDKALGLVDKPWGQRMAAKWTVPDIIAVEETAALPDADIHSVCVPNLLLAKKAPAHLVSPFEVELLPAKVGTEERYFLNFLVTLRRFRKDDAEVVRVPSGAILMMHKANFYAEDIPAEPRAFWFHDGNAPRFLLCNDEFKRALSSARCSGLSFQQLGHAQ
jgi:hypothetical protein